MVSLNFFCEKHGKNTRDQHFAQVSNFLKRESFEKRLCSSKDICNAIVKQQEISNNNNQRINSQIKNKSNTALSEIFRPVQSTYAYVIPTRNTSRMTQAYRYIQNLTNYYNIFVDEGDYLKTHIMSDGVDYKVLEFHDKIETKVDQQINNKQTKADILVPLQANSKHLAKKCLTGEFYKGKINQELLTHKSKVIIKLIRLILLTSFAKITEKTALTAFKTADSD